MQRIAPREPAVWQGFHDNLPIAAARQTFVPWHAGHGC
jgi:hypothetical protein